MFGCDEDGVFEFEAFDEEGSSHGLGCECFSCLAGALSRCGESVVDGVVASLSERDEGAPDFIVQLGPDDSDAVHVGKRGECLRNWCKIVCVVRRFERRNLQFVGCTSGACCSLRCAGESLLLLLVESSEAFCSKGKDVVDPVGTGWCGELCCSVREVLAVHWFEDEDAGYLPGELVALTWPLGDHDGLARSSFLVDGLLDRFIEPGNCLVANDANGGR